MTKTKRRPAPTEKHGGAGPVRKRAEADAETTGARAGAPVSGATLRAGAEHGGRRRRGASAKEVPDGPAVADPMRLGGPPAEGGASASRVARSEAGEYLLGAVREDVPGRFGTLPGPVDDHARRVWRNAFGLAVRRRFEPDSPLAEISRVVAGAIHADESAGLPVLAAEMLVRAELGEAVPVDEIAPAVRAGVHLLLFASLVDELALGDGELDTLVTRAELAAAR